MANLAHKTDYLIEGLARNLDQFKGKPRFEAVLSSWLDEIQALEDAAWDVYTLRLLQSGLATGDLLDKIGKQVGQQREGFDDPTFLKLVTARIKANRSDGRRETLIALMQLLTPDTVIDAREYTGAIVLTPMGAITVPPQVIAFEFLARAVAGGVRGTLVWTTSALSGTLLFGYAFNAGAGITAPTSAQSPGYTYGNTRSYPNGNNQAPTWSGGGGTFIPGGAAAGAFTKDGGNV